MSKTYSYLILSSGAYKFKDTEKVTPKMSFEYKGTAYTALELAGESYSISIPDTTNQILNAGKYTVTATLTDDSKKWYDGTSDPKEIIITVTKAVPVITVNPDHVNADEGTSTAEVDITVSAKGSDTIVPEISSSDNTVAEASINESGKLVISIYKTGTANISVKTAETDNYEAAAVKKIPVVCKAAVYHTVSFDTDGGESVNTQSVKDGEKASKPADPVKAEDSLYTYAFSQWTLNGTEYDFDTPVTSDITVKAVYVKTEKPVYYTVSFDLNGGEGNVPEDQIILKGNTVIKPSIDPTHASDDDYNYTFLYWSDDEGNEFDFTTPVTQNMTLHAKYEANEKPQEETVYAYYNYFTSNSITIGVDFPKADTDNSALIENALKITEKDTNITFDLNGKYGMWIAVKEGYMIARADQQVEWQLVNSTTATDAVTLDTPSSTGTFTYNDITFSFKRNKPASTTFEATYIAQIMDK